MGGVVTGTIAEMSILRPLLNNQLGMEGAGAFERLEYGDQIAARDPQRVQGAGETAHGDRPVHDPDGPSLLRYTHLRARHNNRSAVGERVRLRHFRLFRLDDGQVAVRDRQRGDLHLLAGNDGSGPFVDDDTGSAVGRYLEKTNVIG